MCTRALQEEYVFSFLERALLQPWSSKLCGAPWFLSQSCGSLVLRNTMHHYEKQ